LELFRADFAAAVVQVIPAASHHIDYEVSVRKRPDGRVVALVNDVAEGARALCVRFASLSTKQVEPASESAEESRFATPGESAEANLARVAAALRCLAAARAQERDMDAGWRDWRAVFDRQTASRRGIRAALQSLGWQVVAVPSASLGATSFNALNGLQLSDRFLQPRLGRSFDELADAAKSAAETALGVPVVPITADESMIREGGLRCSAMVFGLGG
jgi:hypothetical protein